MADTELLTPPKTHDKSMRHLYRPHSASPTSPPDVVTDVRCAHSMRALALASTAALRLPLALTIRTRALDGDADQRAPVGRHRPAIVVPIRMFPGQTTIIIHKRFHGFG